MTRRLILIRHAKSDWSAPVAGDHARPLNARGRRAADRIGNWLAAQRFQPDVALVSSARRTRETWERIAAAAGFTVPVALHDALYHASPEEMRLVLETAQAPVVAMVGHNPGCAGFARRLLAEPPDEARFARFPTATTAVIDFDIPEWRDIRWHSGQLVALAFPRDLS
ncbi:MAG: histidine phosphatase family protein [Alphaproteobacteria bacterium]|nr:MAG: histidine phosphatase family protein [Alphaproteobacteria bacterium]